MPVAGGPVHLVKRREIELVDNVDDEPGEVALGQPFAQVGRQQENRWLRSERRELSAMA
jgi:hypothetical protein